MTTDRTVSSQTPRCARSPLRINRHNQGFTLVELVIVILILAILGGLTTGILLQPFRAFQDQSRRATLVAEADLALTRMVRELRMALPNSVRVAAGGQHVEFIPSIAGGRYRALPQPGATAGTPEADHLDFSAADTSFQVLGGLVGDSGGIAGKHLVIYNASSAIGTSANAYEPGNRSPLAAPTYSGGILSFASKQFPFPSLDAQRFDIVDQPVSFFCQGGTLYRASGYGFASAQPTSFTAAQRQPLASGASSCAFSYAPGDHIRNGVVSLQLTLEREGESVSLLYQAQVVNAP